MSLELIREDFHRISDEIAAHGRRTACGYDVGLGRVPEHARDFVAPLNEQLCQTSANTAG